MLLFLGLLDGIFLSLVPQLAAPLSSEGDTWFGALHTHFARYSPVTGTELAAEKKKSFGGLEIRKRLARTSLRLLLSSNPIIFSSFSFSHGSFVNRKKRWWKWCIGTCSREKIKIMDETPSASAHYIKKMFLLAFMSWKNLIFYVQKLCEMGRPIFRVNKVLVQI